MGKEDIWSPRPQEDVDFRTPRYILGSSWYSEVSLNCMSPHRGGKTEENK